MKLKLFYLLALMGCICMPAMAFEDYDDDTPKAKPNVFFDYFSRPSDVKFSWAEDLRSKVMEGIQATSRVEVIDVDSKDILKIEQSRREEDNFSAGDDLDRLAVMTQEGADFLISGSVTSITSSKQVDKDTQKVTYSAQSAFSLKVINPKDGKVITTKTFTGSCGSTGIGLLDALASTAKATPEEAMAAANSSATSKMKKFVDEVSPSGAKCLSSMKSRKTKPRNFTSALANCLA
ncbi:MAG: penicillin-binding protein activator LpoB [Bacteroidales bacterium]|nr:penicillin-binding protein activator LpoB [Bacteroidales bacterium]